MLRPLRVKPPQIQWSPFATLGLSALGGSYFGTYLPANPLFWMMFAAIVLSFGICCVQTTLKTTLLSISIFLIFLSGSGAESTPPTWAPILQNDVCELDLLIKNDPVTSPRTHGAMSAFDYREDSTWCFADATTPLQHKDYLRIRVCFTRKTNIYKNTRITCVGWLHESTKEKNRFTFYVIGNQNSIGIKKPGGVLNTIQHRIREILLRNLANQEITLASALFFGLRTPGWDELANTYKHAGMSHILAISGLHVGLMLLIATTLFTRQNSKPWWSTLVLFVTAAMIILVVEARPPVLRSIAMVLFLVTIKSIGSRCKSVGILGIVAIVFLFYDPKVAKQISFQLTFIVVASLCVLLPQIYWRILGPNDPNDKIKTLILRGFGSLWLTGACAWGISTPIISHVFGIFSPAGLLSSVPSIAFLSLTIVVGIIKILSGVLGAWAVDVFSGVFSITLRAMTRTAVFFTETTRDLFIDHISLTWTQALAPIVWLTAWSLLRKNRGWLWVTLPAVVFFITSPTTPSNTTRITTINVGHGTCHVIQNGDHTTMIDAGSRNNLDIGKTVLIGTLRQLRVHKINTLIITHADLDHLAGLVDVFNTVLIQKLIIAPQTLKHKTNPLRLILELARSKNTEVVLGMSGWTESVPRMKFSIISPQETDSYSSSNASSIVLLLRTNRRSILFTGDINETKIAQLAKQNLRHIDVIELPHHGQWSNESQALIDKLLPWAVIQSTNISRHAKDGWKIPRNTTRFVTAVDGNITTSITEDGKLSISGSNDPVTMPTCVFPK